MPRSMSVATTDEKGRMDDRVDADGDLSVDVPVQGASATSSGRQASEY